MSRIVSALLIVFTSFFVGAQSASADGRYEVVLMSLSKSANADAMLVKFEDMGLSVELSEVNVNGTYFSRLTLDGFESRETAQARADEMKTRLGNESIWVNKR